MLPAVSFIEIFGKSKGAFIEEFMCVAPTERDCAQERVLREIRIKISGRGSHGQG